MNDYQKAYYHKMKERGRLIPIRNNNKMIGLLTFFIGNGDASKYVREDSWSVVEDGVNGNTCYIDHLVGSKGISYAQDSLKIWSYLKHYWKSNFKNVKKIRWNRVKNNRVKVYETNI